MTRQERADRFDAEELAGARATEDAMNLVVRYVPAWLTRRTTNAAAPELDQEAA